MHEKKLFEIFSQLSEQHQLKECPFQVEMQIITLQEKAEFTTDEKGSCHLLLLHCCKLF